jgi:hypothetical protein
MSHVAANKNPAGRKGPSSPNPQSQRPDTKGQQANKQYVSDISSISSVRKRFCHTTWLRIRY